MESLHWRLHVDLVKKVLGFYTADKTPNQHIWISLEDGHYLNEFIYFLAAIRRPLHQLRHKKILKKIGCQKNIALRCIPNITFPMRL